MKIYEVSVPHRTLPGVRSFMDVKDREEALALFRDLSEKYDGVRIEVQIDPFA